MVPAARAVCGRSAPSLARRALSARAHPPPRSASEVESSVTSNDDGRSLNFSLSGTGPAFFSWMVGFCHGLQENGLATGRSNFMGVSGGAICSVLLAAGVDMSADGDVMVCGQDQSDRCRDGRQKLGTLVSNMAEELICEEVLPSLIGKGNVNIAVANAPGGSLMKALRSEAILYNNFRDKEDIVGALSATTHLPYISDGKATVSYRGREVVDAGIVGQMFVPAKGKFVHVSIFPPADYVPPDENALGQFVVGQYSKWNNRAGAEVHAHPYLAEGFGLGIFGRDDVLLRPLARDEALRRHALGYEAFRKWFEARSGSEGVPTSG